MRYRSIAALGMMLGLGCGDPDPRRPHRAQVMWPPAEPSELNLMVIVADDVGAEQVGAYALPYPSPPTPHIDRLAAEGVLFERAWANPVCSPTRAQILTGRHAFRTGVGLGAKWGSEPWAMSYDEVLLPEALKQAGFVVQTAAVGKWHLGHPEIDGAANPNLHGFDHFAGSLGNLIVEESVEGLPQDYWDWEYTVDGVTERTTEYATTRVTDDALDLAHTMGEPWLLYVSYQAAHDPYHMPPAGLHTQGAGSGRADLYAAMVESLDTEVGRLLDTLDPELRRRTLVVFVGDNGSPGGAARPPLTFDTAKKSIYEAGLRVPLIFSGPGVARPGSRVAHLAGAIDIFATLLDLGGVPLEHPVARAGADSVSLAPLLADPDGPAVRDTAYAERFIPAGFGPYTLYDQAIRDDGYKLHRQLDGTERLYRLDPDWLEGDDLLASPDDLDAEDEAALERLRSLLPVRPPT